MSTSYGTNKSHVCYKDWRSRLIVCELNQLGKSLNKAGDMLLQITQRIRSK